MRLFKKEVLFTILFILLGLTAAKQAVAQELKDVHSNLYGRVVDGSTMQYLADVEVRIQGLERVASTDEKGRFAFDNVEPGSYTVVVRVPGFKEWIKEVDVADEGTELKIVLERKEGI
ncbi:MAG TPA: carboxypeptidase-like regulatory domain-containing protein [Balneolaceae bacterium]|nr:carboxypeptidase-like regulatory domain-containing protein [Balneolaceae bacterium]